MHSPAAAAKFVQITSVFGLVPTLRQRGSGMDCTTSKDGKATWDSFPEVECWTGEHQTYAIVSAVTLLLFIPVALRLGAVDGDTRGCRSRTRGTTRRRSRRFGNGVMG